MPTFLIADADRNFREALAIALRLDEHLALATGSADEAIARLGGGGVTCCVVDAHLPGADELADAAARAGARVVITGPYPELLARAARRHPGAEPLPKPFRATELADSPAHPS
jgi:DNA-binding NtrC family response regulator